LEEAMAIDDSIVDTPDGLMTFAEWRASRAFRRLSSHPPIFIA
jgi:hypothetical protein